MQWRENAQRDVILRNDAQGEQSSPPQVYWLFQARLTAHIRVATRSLDLPETDYTRSQLFSE